MGYLGCKSGAKVSEQVPLMVATIKIQKSSNLTSDWLCHSFIPTFELKDCNHSG